MIAFGRKPLRLIDAPPLAPEVAVPKVSIHIPAYSEPPEMLKQTLDAVARLDYPNFECVVVINNTPDPALWLPIEEHCRTLGERFKFVNADNLQGFKAGALRLAMVHTAADAEIIGVIDADYVVQPDWLKDLVPLFADPKVGSGAGAAGSPRRRAQPDASRHERRICRLLRHRHGAAERGQRHHRARHHVPDPPRRAGSRRRLVERHDLRGHRSRPHAARARLARALHQPALRPRPAARHLRGLQEAAPPLGLWRLPDPEEALAPLPARREPAHRRPEARIRARLAQLARRRKHRRRGRHPQHHLGAGRRLPRHRDARPHSHHADHRQLRRVAGAFRDAVPAARAHRSRASCSAAVFAAMSVQWTVARAVGFGVDQGSSAVRAHRQGRPAPHDAISTPSGKRCWRAC